MTAAVRRRIYNTVAAVITVLTVLGYVRSDDAPLWLAVVNAVLAVVVAALALKNLNATTWARFRGAVYALVAAAAPALATIGIRIDERWPAVLAQIFTIAAATLATLNVPDEPPAVDPPP